MFINLEIHLDFILVNFKVIKIFHSSNYVIFIFIDQKVFILSLLLVATKSMTITDIISCNVNFFYFFLSNNNTDKSLLKGPCSMKMVYSGFVLSWWTSMGKENLVG